MPDEVLEKYKYNQHCLLCTVDLGPRSGSELSFVSTKALATMKTLSIASHIFRYRLFFFKTSGCSTKVINLQIQNSHTILSVAS